MQMFTRIHHLLGRVLCHSIVGAAFSAVFRGWIPSRGFVFDINNDYVPVDNAARLYWGLYERNEIRQ